MAAVLATGAWAIEAERAPILNVKRVHIEPLTGDQTAAQIRDMIINALQASGLFVITEKADKADAVLRGSAEDTVFTDTFQTSEGVNARASLGGSSGAGSQARRGNAGIGIGLNEAEKIVERKHEAIAAVRLVSVSTGDVIWATTQESLGAKFKGASADVADKVVKQLFADIERARRGVMPLTK
jgi:curli biogenesis system outer membrane secretion channel CsgG